MSAKIPYSEEAERLIEAAYDPALSDGLRTGPADMATLEPLLRRLWKEEGGCDGVDIVRAASPSVPKQAGAKEIHRGSAWMWWIARYECGARLGVTYDANDHQAIQDSSVIVRTCGGVWCTNERMWVVDFPSHIHIQETPGGPRLHRDGGPAIEYADGWGCYSLWDVTVPSWLAVTPSAELDPSKVLEITNADVRRVGLRKIGLARCLDVLKAKELDHDTLRAVTDGSIIEHPYRLLSMQWPGRSGVAVVLEMRYPSGPQAGEPVLETVAPWCRTCAEARAWRVIGCDTEVAFRQRLAEYVAPSALT
jgi:uncharacterized protein DUF6745